MKYAKIRAGGAVWLDHGESVQIWVHVMSHALHRLSHSTFFDKLFPRTEGEYIIQWAIWRCSLCPIACI